MEYNIVSTKKFDRDIKTYHKKFKNVGEDIKEVIDELKKRKFGWKCYTKFGNER